MNFSTYIFGSFGDGYSQYPNDYTQSIFKNCYNQSYAPIQIVVHRQDRIMYYSCIRKLDAGQYLGLSIVLNSVMLTDFKGLFSVIENIIISIADQGIILKHDEKGNVISVATKLSSLQPEISRVAAHLHNGINRLEATSKILPPVSFGVGINANQYFSIEDDNIDEIIRASATNDYTIISKQRVFPPTPPKRFVKFAKTFDKVVITIIVVIMMVVGGIFLFQECGKNMRGVLVSCSPVVTGDTVTSDTDTGNTVTGDTVTGDTVTGDTVTGDTVTGDTNTAVIDTAIDPKTSPISKEPFSGNMTIHLSYGTYTGEVKNGYPHGHGKLEYSTTRQINRTDGENRMAHAGQYIEGEFYNGFVYYGDLYDEDNSPLEHLTFGKVVDGYDSK